MNQIENVLDYIAQIIELISTGILLTGFGKAAFGFVKTELSGAFRTDDPNGLSLIRLQLGTYILLGLDFYIVSDIIHSMIRPELNELVSLAVIVVMRTTIGFFLGKEIAEIKRSEE
ncbi:MAG: DUF1622 domain-containing protein [Lewinellaceae bacterium]|nr:DUF1622 domain-containing protein [Saprospiraceae bacterium]MCB9340227.1 DUF1622 domain-containing protein [Lewinellaceae bacterium]